ncbi:protein ALP1-like [Rhopalosiphum maidis]|uniref:protein ALP1-like n=1 Tax=Rhopalosiphum maidis TaxID=43146 RepID=UPI000EFFBAF9|nr:protein ALP1-like [Rhopalosiphum maidis]
MHNECIPTPNEEKLLEIAEGYQQRAQFPNCIGAIGGKHIRVIKPHGKTTNDSLNIPKPNLIRGIQIPMPYVFVGDEAFGLSTNMLRPYAGKCLLINKRIFNYRLSRARRYVECAFGILSNKWRIFHCAIDVDIELTIDIVKCCCVLHNFVRARDGYEFEDSLMVTGMDDIELDNNLNVNRSINRYRDALTNYFNSELGQVAWQNEKI